MQRLHHNLQVQVVRTQAQPVICLQAHDPCVRVCTLGARTQCPPMPYASVSITHTCVEGVHGHMELCAGWSKCTHFGSPSL